MRPPVFARQLASLDDVLALWHEHGGRRHGPGPVTHSQHALWTAALARQAGAGDALVTAALFHDFGYLLHMAGLPSGGGGCSTHDVLGATLLAEIFPPEVTEPIRLHEEAGRFLSWQQADYPRRLADAQRRDLTVRGGPMSASEACRFLAARHSADAIRLRRWDDAAHHPDMPMPGWQPLLQTATRCLRDPART